MAHLPIVRGTREEGGQAPPFKTNSDQWGGCWGEMTLSETWVVDHSNWMASLPVRGALHPSYDWMIAESFQCRQQTDGKRGHLVLNYKQDGFDTGEALPDPPEDECDKSANVIEIDIRRHPKFSVPNPAWSNLSLQDFYDYGAERIFHTTLIPAVSQDLDGVIGGNPNEGEAVPLEIRGMSRYVVGSGTVHCREYLHNAPPNVFLRAGKRAVPAAFPGGSDLFWLIVSGNESKSGAFFVWEEVFQLSLREMSPWVYDAA